MQSFPTISRTFYVNVCVVSVCVSSVALLLQESACQVSSRSCKGTENKRLCNSVLLLQLLQSTLKNYGDG